MTPDQIKKEFLEIYDTLAPITVQDVLEGRHQEAYPCFDRLDQMAVINMDDHTAERLRTNAELFPVLEHISRLKRTNGLRLEIRNAKIVINSATPWETVKQFVYYPNYLELARMEYTGGHLSPGDRVVFLGSGPMPLTLICLCTRYNIIGIGIEQFKEYAQLSRQLIQALDLSNKIQIIQGNHFCLPLSDPCKLIMIGADALPKDEIFAHLSASLEGGTALSYRIYEKGLRRLLDVQSGFTLPQGIKEVRRIRPEPPVNNTSVFAIKERFPNNL